MDDRELLTAIGERESKALNGVTERMGENALTEYAFYQTAGQRMKRFYFTCCGNGETVKERQATARHKKDMICPFCGRQVLACCVGRLRRDRWGEYPCLWEKRNVALLDELGGGIAVSVGRLERRWVPGRDSELCGWPELDEAAAPLPWPEPDDTFRTWRRYYIAPGQVKAWKANMIWQERPDGDFEVESVFWTDIKRPNMRVFKRSSLITPDPENGNYVTVGVDAVSRSSLKYCAIEQYFGPYWADGLYGDSAVGYLMAYARYPQLEMLAKLGYDSIIEDLIESGQRHTNRLDWRAKTPWGFFRMSKAEYKVFQAAGGNLSDLEQYQDIAAEMCISFQSYFQEKQRLVAGLKKPGRREMVNCAGLAQRCGVTIHQAVSYAIAHGGTGIWADYIDAAEKLDYDLTRPDVAMPKDLMARHDAATAAVAIGCSQKALERYKRRILPGLRRRYEFTWDGLQILVPRNDREIIMEGRAMCHCVGGYTARHMEGKVVILFLRQAEAPEVPFVTIEMNGERLVQARGYRNDRGANSTPQTRHPEFFAVWLEWLKAGSPRLVDGTPVIPKNKEEKTA